jgi:hypothetical protein
VDKIILAEGDGVGSKIRKINLDWAPIWGIYAILHLSTLMGRMGEITICQFSAHHIAAPAATFVGHEALPGPAARTSLPP